jgi:hypothetical protein
MKRVAAVLLCFFTCWAGLESQANGPVLGTVSLIRVIASPRDFDGKRVRLIGYVANNGIDGAVGLYISESDARNFVVPNSVDLKIETAEVDKFTNEYAILEGTFHAPKGRWSDYTNGE